MEAYFGKKYRLTQSDNFDELMKALGVGFLTRKAGGLTSPAVELSKDGDLYVMKTTSTFKDTEIKFKPGVEFDEKTPDGRDVKSTVTFNGNKMLHIQKGVDGGKDTTIEREFGEKEMKAIMKVDDIVCTRTYTLEE